MTLRAGDLVQNIYDSGIGTYIREDPTMFPWLESTHVVMVAIIFGTIAMVDLRLLGVAAHRPGADKLIREMLPFTWMAFLGAVVTGAALFASNATMYIESFPFKMKILMLALAGINMAVFHMTAYRRIAEWDHMLPPPRAARIAGATSIILWTAVIVLGRWIGFSPPLV